MTGTVKLPEGVEMVMPGDNVAMEVELIAPVAMDEGLRFAIREGRQYRRGWCRCFYCEVIGSYTILIISSSVLFWE